MKHSGRVYESLEGRVFRGPSSALIAMSTLVFITDLMFHSHFNCAVPTTESGKGNFQNKSISVQFSAPDNSSLGEVL